MDNEISFKMSLLLDGELTAQETVELWKNIEQDPALAEQWKRYNQVRSVMNSQPPVTARPDLVDSVHQALLSEPTAIRPKQRSIPKHTPKSNVVTLRRTGMVAASAVLGLMVYGGYQQQLQQVVPVSPQPSIADVMADNIVAERQLVEIQPVEIRTQPVHASASRVFSSTQIPSERAFNDYLVTHGEYAYAHSPQPLTPVARVISYNIEP
jgi:negative regulator of sigma E activity